MESLAHGCADWSLGLFQRLLPSSKSEELREDLDWSGGGGLFSAALTIWLFVRQRIMGGATVESTWLSTSLEEVRLLSPRSARAKKDRLSEFPSGLNQARRSLPLELARQAAFSLIAEARTLLKTDAPIYLLDGSSLTLENHPALVKKYPPASNRLGESHWPVVRMVVAHELATGLASVPEWGPMFGSSAVSEQELGKRILRDLPPGGWVIADRNFGVYSIAWAAREQVALLRLTDVRAGTMLKEDLAESVDRPFTWKPSKADRKTNPEIPSDAQIHGRLVVIYITHPSSKKPVRVCLFTTDFTLCPEELARLYAKRWNIETDLRSMKQEVGLEILRSRNPETLAKDLIFAVVAYDLTRVFMALAAKRKGIEPRRMSFSRARSVITLHAHRGPLTDERLNEILDHIAGVPLPIRKPRKHPPREVWKKASPYTARKVKQT